MTAPVPPAGAHRARLRHAADIAAVATVATLPWSTSATSIALGVWLVLLLPTLRTGELEPALRRPAGWLPVALALLAVAATLWSAGTWPERLSAAAAYGKLLAVPLLMAQSAARPLLWRWAVAALLVSATLLLAASWATWFLPGLPRATAFPGIPVKDWITQGGIFTLAAFIAAHRAFLCWRAGWRREAGVLAGLVVVLIANVGLVPVSRTALAVLPVLAALFAVQRLGFARGGAAALAAALLGGALLWTVSPSLRDRVIGGFNEVEVYTGIGYASSVGLRLEWYQRAAGFIAAAPVFGQGTGSVAPLYRAAADGRSGAAGDAARNPHNELLFVGIETGLAGVALLLAMWLAHAGLFLRRSPAGMIGLGVVAQNVASSLANSHLHDFTQGWLYVLLVGLLAGEALRPAQPRGELVEHGPGQVDPGQLPAEPAEAQAEARIGAS